MSPSAGTESALLIACPVGEPVVAADRAKYDRAARVGVPAHVTVTYPFKAAEHLTDADHARLQQLFAARPAFVLTGARTVRFGNVAVYVELQDPRPVVALIEAVAEAFPQFPPYGGAFDTVIPHMTIGHDHPVEQLRAAEREVLARLPFTQQVTGVELWAGPALGSGLGPGQRLRTYPLG